MDETYIKVQGQWCYLYRGIDEYGNLLDVRLSEHRDMEAAKAFFEQVTELMATAAIPARFQRYWANQWSTRSLLRQPAISAKRSRN